MANTRICSVLGCDKPHEARGWCNAHYKKWKRNNDPLGGNTPDGEAERYLHEVVLQYRGDECLIWPYTRAPNGYGRLLFGGGLKSVHRVVCEAVNGTPPTPLHEAAHSCGKGHEGCCAPLHLSWKTHTENMADTIAHGTHSRGERHGCSKLTESSVREIRALAGKMPQSQIAAQFGVSYQQVYKIISRTLWKHV